MCEGASDFKQNEANTLLNEGIFDLIEIKNLHTIAEDNLSIRNYPLLLKKDNFLLKNYLITNIIRNFAPKRSLR